MIDLNTAQSNLGSLWGPLNSLLAAVAILRSEKTDPRAEP